MKPKVGSGYRDHEDVVAPGGLAYGANVWASRRMRRKTAGNPMFSARGDHEAAPFAYP
jgi:hypothetical protein